MTSPAEGFRAILENLGAIGGATGWMGVVGGLTPEGKQVAFLDHGGRGGEVKVAIDYPNVQMIVRGQHGAGGYTETYNKAKEVFDKMQGLPTPHASWAELVSAVGVHQPQWLGRDDKDRPQFSVNFRLITLPENEVNRTY